MRKWLILLCLGCLTLSSCTGSPSPSGDEEFPTPTEVPETVKIGGRFSEYDANSEIVTQVTDLSQYRYGAAKICIDGEWLYLDRQGNEISDVNQLSNMRDIRVPDEKPLIDYVLVEQIDQVMILLDQNQRVQCFDLSNRKLLLDREGITVIRIEDDEVRNNIYMISSGSIWGEGQRAIVFGNGNVLSSTVLNLDTKEVLTVDAYYSDIYEGMYRFTEKNLYGFKNLHNEIAVPAIYPPSQRMTDFNEGLALVQKSAEDDHQFIFINKQGEEVLGLTLDYYDEIYPFCDGLARIGRNYLYGYIDTTGKVVVEPQYTRAGHFSHGLAVVAKDGLFGIIDAKGNEKLPLIYQDIERVGALEAVWWGELPDYDLNPVLPITAMQNGQWGYITVTGEEVVPFIYDTYPARDFQVNEGEPTYAILMNRDGTYFAVDPQGQRLSHDYEYMNLHGGFNYGMMLVGKAERYGFINTEFNEVVPLNYTAVAYSAGSNNYETCYADDLACMRNGEKLSLIDRQGNELMYFN